MGNDAKPYERYEDYMKRRLKEEDIKWKDHTQTTEELYRQNILQLTAKVAILEHNVKELQGYLQNAYKRIQEVINERDEAQAKTLSQKHDT